MVVLPSASSSCDRRRGPSVRLAGFERKIPELADHYPDRFEIVENSRSRFGWRRVSTPIVNADELDGFLENYPVYTPAERMVVLDDLRHKVTANGIDTLRLRTNKERSVDQE
jgi:hypothetical protein